MNMEMKKVARNGPMKDFKKNLLSFFKSNNLVANLLFL
jgi:hypothetical protein